MGAAWLPGETITITSSRPEGFRPADNWKDLPIKVVPISGNCAAFTASDFDAAEEIRKDLSAGLDDGFRNGLLELGLDFPGNPPAVNLPDWLLYVLVAAGLLSGYNASKRGITVVNGVGMTAGGWAVYRLLKKKL